VRRVFVHHEQATPGDASQVPAVPVAARPLGGGRLFATATLGGRDDLESAAAQSAATGGRPLAAAAGVRPQAARVHVHRKSVMHLPSGRLPLPGIRDIRRHARVPVPSRPSHPLHGALLPMGRRVRGCVPARCLRPPVFRLRRTGNVHITIAIS